MSRSDIKPAHRIGVAASIYKGATTGRGAACGPSCLSASVPAAAKSPAQLPLPWGEVGPQVRVRGAGLTWRRGHLIPSPQPSPPGRGSDIAGVAASGGSGSTSGEGIAARHASSGRGAACGPSCPSASAPAAAKSPAQLPLLWGEVGPQVRVRGAGLSWIRGHLIPSPQPSPHGRGSDIAGVAASGISGSISGKGLAARHASSGREFAFGPSCPSASVPAAAKSPAQLPLPWGEVGPQVRVRGAGLSWMRGHLIPSPQPSPHGRGSDIAGVAASGISGSISGKGLAARHASSGREFAFGPSCPSASVPAAAKSPAQLPLPWGEVGPQVRVRGAGLTWRRGHLIPSPQPSPHGRGSDIAGVAASRAGRLPVRALASITAFFERASGNTLHAL